MDPVISRILFLIKNGALTAAIAASADFARRNPERAECYGLLAHAEEVAGYTRAAIQSVSHAIALGPHENAYFLQRARLNIKINRLADAVADINHLIQTGDEEYVNAAIAYRNEVLARQQRASRSAPKARAKFLRPSPM